MALNRTVAASLLLLTAAVVLAVACGSGDETIEPRETQAAATETTEKHKTQPDAAEPDEERETQPDAAEPEIVFLGDFTEAEQAAIAREVKSVQAAFAERFGVVTSEFTLYISTEYEALNEAYREWLAPEWRRRGVELPDGFTCNGLTGREAIFIAIESCDHPTRARGGPIAHEYFHILQLHLGFGCRAIREGLDNLAHRKARRRTRPPTTPRNRDGGRCPGIER